MTGPDDHAHDAHADHPAAGTIVGLAFVALFGAIFAALTTKSFDASIAITVVLLAGWMLYSLWSLDRD